jgi:hypothetical protein
MRCSVQYNLDGAPHVNTSMPLPFPDALQEFRLSTGAQEAASGGHSAAVVDAVTKSGTNAFHGDLFEFFRNSDLNARHFFFRWRRWPETKSVRRRCRRTNHQRNMLS